MADESLGKIVLNKRNIIIINHESNDELMVKHLTVWRHDRIVDKWYDTQKLGVLQEKLTTDLLGPMVTSSLSSSSTPRSEVAVPLDGRQRGSSSFINIQAILTANVGIYIEEFLTKSLGPFVELAIVRKNSGNEVWKNTQHMAEAANQVPKT